MGFTKENNPNKKPEPKKRSKLLGGISARAVGEAVLVAAVLSVVAFWQGDVVSDKIGVFLDAGKAWPVDGVLAVLLGAYMALNKKIKPINKVRFAAPLVVYGANSIYNARVNQGLPVGT